MTAFTLYRGSSSLLGFLLMLQVAAYCQPVIYQDLDNGLSSTFYQIGFGGAIHLRNLEENTDVIVGNIDLKQIEIPLILHGRRLPGTDILAMFFLKRELGVENLEMQLYTYNLKEKLFCKHDFITRMTGDFGIFYDKNVIWVKYFDVEKLVSVNVVYSPTTKKSHELINCVLGTGNILSPKWDYSPKDNSYVYMLYGSSSIVKMNIESDTVYENLRVMDFRSATPQNGFFFGISGDDALLSCNAPEAAPGYFVFEIINLITKETIASSVTLQKSKQGFGEFLLPQCPVSYFEIASLSHPWNKLDIQKICRYKVTDKLIELDTCKEYSSKEYIIFRNEDAKAPHFFAFPKDIKLKPGIEALVEEFWALREKHISALEALREAIDSLGAQGDSAVLRENELQLRIEEKQVKSK